VTDKPLPVADADSQTFWDACAAGRLIAQRCDDCGRWRHPPRGVCPGCGSWSFAWHDLPNRGKVRSFVVPHRPFSPGFADDVPYVVVYVAVDGTDGQVLLVSNLQGLAWQDVAVGMPVECHFDDRGLPYFTRA